MAGSGVGVRVAVICSGFVGDGVKVRLGVGVCGRVGVAVLTGRGGVFREASVVEITVPLAQAVAKVINMMSSKKITGFRLRIG